jgi:predicted dehydrogenase
VPKSAYASGSDVIKVGLVGCGGRGTGAAAQALTAAPNIHLVAMADVFEDQITKSYQNLLRIDEIKDQVQVPDENKFASFEGYKHVIEASDVVLLCTPPAFRPEHFEECVKMGKHSFVEKPVASDAPGLRKVLEAGKIAEEKKLKVVVGLQNRYDPGYQEMVQQIQSGKIGQLLSSTCYYMKGQYKVIPRSEVNTELEFQVKNYHYFNWLWAGGPAGLNIHNTDIVNWVKGDYPVQAQGMGGRAAVSGPDTGDVFDNFYIEYTYADGVKIHSQVRVTNNVYNKNGAFFLGTEGTANLREGIKDLKGNKVWRYRNKENPNPYQIEHDKLFEAIMKDLPLNDTEFGAKSTMVAIMGRMASHSGKLITWDEAFNSDRILVPENLRADSVAPILPDENGIYPYPIPGQTVVL